MWVACLTPLTDLVYRLWTDQLGANPISFVTNTLGDTTLRILLATLALTPLRIVSGVSWPITLRRVLGLFAFFYACLHFSIWIVVDHFFDWHEMGTDILKRPYITVGMAALTLLIPLACTSTTAMVKRLGGAGWRRLHRIVYGAAALGVLHFLWLAKVGRREQYLYATVLAVLLGVRVAEGVRRRLRRRRERLVAAGPTLVTSGPPMVSRTRSR